MNDETDAPVWTTTEADRMVLPKDQSEHTDTGHSPDCGNRRWNAKGVSSKPTTMTEMIPTYEIRFGIQGRVSRYAPPIASAGTAGRNYHSKTALPTATKSQISDATVQTNMRRATMSILPSGESLSLAIRRAPIGTKR